MSFIPLSQCPADWKELFRVSAAFLSLQVASEHHRYYYSDTNCSSCGSCSHDHISTSSLLSDIMVLVRVVQLQWKVRPFFQNQDIGWCLEGSCWEILTTELLCHKHTKVCHTHFSSCPPSHLPHFLFLSFLVDEEHPVPVKQEVVMIQWEQTMVCFSVCVSHIVQSSSKSLSHQMPVAWPLSTHHLAMAICIWLKKMQTVLSRW